MPQLTMMTLSQVRAPNLTSISCVGMAHPQGTVQGDGVHDNAKVWRYFVYLKYWTLNFRPLMVYTKVLFPPNFGIKAKIPSLTSISCINLGDAH